MSTNLLWKLIKPSEKPTSETEKMVRGISWPQLFMGIIGFGVSLWALVLHVQIKTGSAGSLVCDINETVNCTKIIGSEYGELFHIPLGTYGMSYWGIVIAFAFLSYFIKGSARYIRTWQLLVASIGAAFALGLAFIAYIVIQGICEVCAVVQISCLVHFFIVLLAFLRVKSGSIFGQQKAFLRLAITTIIAGIIPLTSAWAASVVIAKSTPASTASIASSEINKFAGQTPTGDWYKGAASAKVELMEFTDFECPYCQVLHEKIKELHESVGKGNLKVVFRNWPLSYHKYSEVLALAARCAGWQGKFWDFTDWAFETCKVYATDPAKKNELFSNEGLIKKAESMGLSSKEFIDCLTTKQEGQKLKSDIIEAEKLGGKGTPFILINGKIYEGNWLNSDEFEAAIQKARIE